MTPVIKAVCTCSVIPLLPNFLVLKRKPMNFRGKLNKLVLTMNSCTKWIWSFLLMQYTGVLVPDLKAFGVNLQTLYLRIAHLVMFLSAQLDKLANHH